MSLIVSQMPVKRLPAELVQNAAFVKQVDFDPVHETAATGQPAEKIHGSARPSADRLTVSAEALAAAKNISLSPAAEKPDTAEPSRQRPAVIDITDPASAERRQRGEAMGRAMRSWNATVESLKRESESSSAYGYAETVRLFKTGYADWQRALQTSEPAAYRAWFQMLNGNRSL